MECDADPVRPRCLTSGQLHLPLGVPVHLKCGPTT